MKQRAMALKSTKKGCEIRLILLSWWIPKLICLEELEDVAFSVWLPWSPKGLKGLFLSSTTSPFLNLIVRATTETGRPYSPDDWVDSRRPKGQAITVTAMENPCLGHLYSLSGPFVA